MLGLNSKNNEYFNSPTKWVRWKYTKSVDLSLTNVSEIIHQIRLHAGIPFEQNLLNPIKITKLVNATSTRRWWIICCIITSIILFSLAFIVGLAYIASNSYLAFLVCCLLSILGVFVLLKKRNLERDDRTNKLADFIAPELSLTQKLKVIEYLTAFQSRSEPIFELGNQGALFKIFDEFWNTENWFLLFTENENDRKAICLEGNPPQGKIYFQINLISEEGLSIEKNFSIPGKIEGKRNRNKRNKRLQLDALSNLEMLTSTLEVIYKAYPIDAVTDSRKLIAEKSARLVAMEYLAENPDFLKATRNLNRMDAIEFSKHKRKIIGIFAPISRPTSTLKKNAKKPGETLADDFLTGKDRAFENWLFELSQK